MWGPCEPGCHGNWTPHSGPWREDTEPYLSTFTSQSVTWPAVVLQLEQQTQWSSCTLQEVLLWGKILVCLIVKLNNMGQRGAPLIARSFFFDTHYLYDELVISQLLQNQINKWLQSSVIIKANQVDCRVIKKGILPITTVYFPKWEEKLNICARFLEQELFIK